MQKLSWDEVGLIIDKLAEKIKASGFRPDYLIAITTGGLIPTYFLAKELDIKNILTISATSSKGKNPVTSITYMPEIDLGTKSLLLIDEITETGESLKKVFNEVINKYNPAELKTATLGISSDRTAFFPDFYVAEERGEWFVFPWENKEDFPKYPAKLI